MLNLYYLVGIILNKFRKNIKKTIYNQDILCHTM